MQDQLHDVLMGDLLLQWVDRDILWNAWLDGLRSPTYIQGHGALLCGGRYCPLGVLCSVAGIPPMWPNGPSRPAAFAGRIGSLPSALAQFLDVSPHGGFKNAVPARYAKAYPHSQSKEYPAGSVVSLNDKAEWSFGMQATYLGAHRSNMLLYTAG